MRAFVITIMSMPQSIDVAARCVESGRRFGVDVETWPATTPADDPERIMTERGFSLERFKDNPYSRYLPCVAAFCSHSGLWAKCANEGEPLLILEHDAVFVSPMPPAAAVWETCTALWTVINLGRPSFGKFSVPTRTGYGPLQSKPHLPGAHGYFITPWGARDALEKAKTEACPTDVFLSMARFISLCEYHPWPIEAHDSFTTIQLPLGCKAKHRKVEII